MRWLTSEGTGLEGYLHRRTPPMDCAPCEHYAVGVEDYTETSPVWPCRHLRAVLHWTPSGLALAWAVDPIVMILDSACLC